MPSVQCHWSHPKDFSCKSCKIPSVSLHFTNGESRPLNKQLCQKETLGNNLRKVFRYRIMFFNRPPDVVARLVEEEGRQTDKLCHNIRDIIQFPHKHKHRKADKKHAPDDGRQVSLRQSVVPEVSKETGEFINYIQCISHTLGVIIVIKPISNL